MKELNTLNQKTLAYWKQGKNILIAVLIGKFFSLVWKLLLAHAGPEALGTVEITLAVYFTLQAFSLLGFQTALMRFIVITARTNNGRQWRALFYLVLRITIIISLLIVGSVILFPNVLIQFFRESVPTVTIAIKFIWIVPVLVVSELLWSFLAATGRIKRYAFGKYVLPPITRLVSLILLLGYGYSSEILSLHVVLASLAVTVFSLILSRSLFSTPNVPLSKKDITEFLKFTLPMSGSFLLYTLYEATDVALIGRYAGVTTVGLLSAALVFVDIPNMVVAPILNIFQIHLGSFHASPKQGLSFALKNVAIFLFAGSVFCLGITALSPFLVPLILGRPFADIVPLIGWLLVPTVAEIAIVLPLRHTLDFYGFTKTTLSLMAVSTFTKIAVGLYTVSHYGLYGIIGMQWTSVGIHLIGVIIASWVLLRVSPKKTKQI